MKRTIFTVAILIFGISLALCFAQPSQALTTQGKNGNARGQQLYMTYCASCHGADGKGGGPTAAALKAPLPDLTRVAKQEGKFPALQIRRIISGDDLITGHGSREMPVWGDYFRRTRDKTISTINVYALTKYIESIQTQ